MHAPIPGPVSRLVDPRVRATGRATGRRARRAAAAAEFALTLPVLVLLLLGTIEYGNFFSELAMVSSCARSGARYGGMQHSLQAARVQGALATRQLLTDLGYPCQTGSDTCVVETQILQQTAIDILEIRVELVYDQLTHAIPNTPGIPAIPTVLKARATYPIVEN